MKRFLLCVMLLMSSFAMMAQTHHWTPMTGNQYNMTVYGIIVIDEVPQTVTTLELGAFCGEQCRASEFPMEYLGDYVVPMTILSNATSGEVITFKLYDHNLNQELELNCETTVDFVADAIIIDPSSWFQFAFITPSWNNPNMWPGGVLPNQSSNVSLPDDIIIDNNAQITVASLNTNGNTLTIDNGSTLTVTGTIVNNNPENFVIEDGAQVINESANVAAKAKKSITAYTAKDSNGWHLISSSVNNMLIAGSDFLTETYDLYRYNESSTTWENYRSGHADFTTFEKGRGYLYANSNGISPAFIGTLNNAAVTYSVTAASSTASRGVNIIGNPFPHTIYKGVGGAIDNSNLESGYYELTYSGAWVAHTFDDPILPGQGILVVAKANADVTIAKTNAEATAESASKGDVKRLKIKVNGNGSEDRTYAYFSEGDGLDKLDNFSSSAAQISIINNENNYAIAHVGGECEAMDIVFKNTKNADYTITIEGAEDFDYLHLIDKITGEDVDMLLEQSYTFHATGNEYAERFNIVCRGLDGIGENAETVMFAYINDGDIIVNGEGTLQLIDMTGRIINSIEINGSQMIENPSCGVYILRMINGNEVKTQKIVVK